MSSESLESTEIVTCSTWREIGRTSMFQREWERNRLIFTKFFGFSDITRRWGRGSSRNINRNIDPNTNRSIKVSSCEPRILHPRFRPVLKDMSRPTSMLDWHLTRLITNDKEEEKRKGVEQSYILHVYIYILFISWDHCVLNIYFITACKTLCRYRNIPTMHWFSDNLVISCINVGTYN